MEAALLDYGALGLFVLYLIYDRQILLSKLMQSIDANTSALFSLTSHVKTFGDQNGKKKK